MRRALYAGIITGITFLLFLLMLWKLGDTFFLFGRLCPNGAWIQITASTLFAYWIAYRIYERERRPQLRLRLWTLFAVWFFLQLLLGITADSRFLMSGVLHLPIPSVILTGALYRGEFGFMPILLLSTILLSGGAWCSYFCYFGAFDAIASGAKRQTNAPRGMVRNLFFALFIGIALLLRLVNLPTGWATVIAAFSGIVGLLIILLASPHRRTMVHCTYFCPIGTLISWFKFVSPFRYRITNNCIHCMRCTSVCRYGGLTPESITQHRINRNCTLCGDCQQTCRNNALEYRFLNLSPDASERLFLGVVTVLYVLFLAVARV